MSRPLVALTCYGEPASWGVWRDLPAVLVPRDYVAALARAGAQVLLVPPEQDLSGADAARLLAGFDALVLAGGVDLDPDRYGASPHPGQQPARPDRDDAELALARAAVRADLPLLGICRGMQVMAVAAGGRLEQHLPDRLGHDHHAPAPGEYGPVTVRTAAGSRLRSILGERVEVPCYHHQGVLTVPGYTASAWADGAGPAGAPGGAGPAGAPGGAGPVGAPAESTVLEGIEAPDARWRIGVQWHPEIGADPRLFEALVAAAAG
jgi:putative glutamine amidotransferase